MGQTLQESSVVFPAMHLCHANQQTTAIVVPIATCVMIAVLTSLIAVLTSLIALLVAFTLLLAAVPIAVLTSTKSVAPVVAKIAVLEIAVLIIAVLIIAVLIIAVLIIAVLVIVTVLAIVHVIFAALILVLKQSYVQFFVYHVCY